MMVIPQWVFEALHEELFTMTGAFCACVLPQFPKTPFRQIIRRSDTSASYHNISRIVIGRHPKSTDVDQ